MNGQARIVEVSDFLSYGPAWTASVGLDGHLRSLGFDTEPAVSFGKGSQSEIEILTRGDGHGSQPSHFEFISVEHIGGQISIVFSYPELLRYLHRTAPLSSAALLSTPASGPSGAQG